MFKDSSFCPAASQIIRPKPKGRNKILKRQERPSSWKDISLLREKNESI